MDVILALIWLFGTIVSVFFIVRPKKNWPPYATRGRAACMSVLFFLGLPIFSSLTGLTKPSTSKSTNSNAATASSESAATTSKNVDSASSAPSNWTYDESTDQMRGTSTKYARTSSVEYFENMFHMGNEKTQLEIQKRARGYDVALSNSNLQFTCNSFGDTMISAKFDDGPVSKYGCTNAVGDKYGVAFLTSGGRFVDKLRRAKKVIVEAEIYQRGNVQMTFDVGGLQF